MSAVHAEDVAVALLERQGPLDTIKLQKLTYYCQAWFATWLDAPLFVDDLEAWDNGPVVRRLFQLHKGSYKVGSLARGDSRLLPEDSEGVLEFVCRYYGAWSGSALVNHVHEEDPWDYAYHELGRNAVITLDTIQKYYGGLEDFNEQAWVWLSGAYRDVDHSLATLGSGVEVETEEDFFESLAG